MFTIRKNNFRAFTLIEMLVVMAIVSIMTAVAIVSFGSGRIKKELETNAREFASAVREAQNYALTGRQAAGLTACAFSVTWTSSSTYKFGVTPSGSCGAVPASIVSYSLKNGVTVSNFGTISFQLPWAIVVSGGGSQVIFSKSSNTHSVCVSADGKITDQVGSSSCP
jgi:prepilin-type N-terminal cleavage/methylation domain-containing protein